MLLASCGGDGGSDEPRRTPTPGAFPVETDGELAIGITEPNANLVRTEQTAEPFERWRQALGELNPQYYRLVVDWAQLQPAEGGEFQLEIPNAGCMRDVGPCAEFAGLRDQLRALASRQAEGERWAALVVLVGTPEWAAEGPGACERSQTVPRNRPARPEALTHYADLVGAVLELAEAEGAELRYWSPWNEPNHPAFIASQRASCRPGAPTAAVEPYTRMAEALRDALERAPGEQELVLGELAGLHRKGRESYTSIAEFIRELPEELVCSTNVWGQHGYVGGEDPVDHVARALRRFGCDESHRIWITETGVGGPHAFTDRATSPTAQVRACEALRKRLRRWYRDPRVTAAFQYTLREDDRFPTGLVTTDLSEAYPALEEMQAWGARPRPQDEPPASRCTRLSAAR